MRGRGSIGVRSKRPKRDIGDGEEQSSARRVSTQRALSRTATGRAGNGRGRLPVPFLARVVGMGAATVEKRSGSARTGAVCSAGAALCGCYSTVKPPQRSPSGTARRRDRGSKCLRIRRGRGITASPTPRTPRRTPRLGTTPE
jgi:hypothetical protein